MKRDKYINFLKWFRTEVCEDTPIYDEYFVDKYMKYCDESDKKLLINFLKWRKGEQLSSETITEICNFLTDQKYGIKCDIITNHLKKKYSN